MKSVALIVMGLAIGSGCRPATIEQVPAVEVGPSTDGVAPRAPNQTQVADAGGAGARVPRLIRASANQFESTLEGLKISVKADHCVELASTFTQCAEGARITVTGVGQAKSFTFEVPELQFNPGSMLYRGALDGSYRAAGTTLIVGDMDLDGSEDFALRTGNAGGYGSPSYSIYLQQAGGHGFVYSPDFSELTEGSLGMFSVSADKIRVPRKSGCCEHWDDVFVVKGHQPVFVARAAPQE